MLSQTHYPLLSTYGLEVSETTCSTEVSSQTHPCFKFVVESIMIILQTMNRFSSLWLCKPETNSWLFFWDFPIRPECLSCPRTKVCAHLCRAPAVRTKKPQDAISGPLCSVPSVPVQCSSVLANNYNLFYLPHTREFPNQFQK